MHFGAKPIEVNIKPNQKGILALLIKMGYMNLTLLVALSCDQSKGRLCVPHPT
jgi:hypothetical protein